MTRLLSYLFSAYSFFILLNILSLSTAQGQGEKFIMQLSGNQIMVDEELTVQDDKIEPADLASIESTQSITNKVIFEIDESSPVLKSGPYTFEVKVEISLWDDVLTDDSAVEDADEANFPDHKVYETLSFEYDSTSTSTTTFRSFWLGKDARQMKVKILEFNVSSHSGIPEDDLSNLYNGQEPPLNLIGEILIDRKYNFDCEVVPTLSNLSPLVDVTQTYTVEWEGYQEAEEYDLEWTFYDYTSEVGIETFIGGVFYPDFNFLFRHNATRVTINKMPRNITNMFKYDIPLLYPEGYVFIRVRTARYRADGSREVGKWSSIEFNGKRLFDYTDRLKVGWHEDHLNWQAQTAFAEEGKKVPAVRYFDGSLRERQSVTYSDAIEMSIVGETIYDHQGRPAVTILPTPSFDNTLNYYENYNQNSAGTPYSRTDFDTGDCSNPPSSMNDMSGASHYYSPKNPKATESFHQFIPDANDYPFTVTEYTPDLTGRIKRQSGVGETYKLGSGRETKYFYGKPAQAELDLLFNTQVGNESHYFKNMVVDANQQVSVSYVDAHGRTIATALAGGAPNAVDELIPDLEPVDIFRNLLNNDIGTYTLTSNYTLLVSDQNNYTFTYQAGTASYQPDCEPYNTGDTPQDFCYDCIYDVEIRISDNCGGNLFTENYYNLSGDEAYNDVCGGSTEIIDEIINDGSINLSVGEYHISKTLTLNQDALDVYVESFLGQTNCLPDLDALTQEYIDEIDFTDCNTTCEECLASLGASPSAEAIAACDELCKTPTECESLFSRMVTDLTPGGQYALFNVIAEDIFDDFNTIESIYFPGDAASIFNKDEGATLFRFQSIDYLDENDNHITINIGGETKRVNELSINEFVENYQREWIEILVVAFHPEYCYYEFCKTNEASYIFNQTLLDTESFEDAVNMGILDPNTGQIINDPFFGTGGGGGSDPDAINDQFDNATPDACVPLGLNDIISDIAYCGGEQPCNTEFGGGCEADNDLAWQLTVAVYLGYKRELEEQYIADNIPVNCNNICIGNPAADCTDCEIPNRSLCGSTAEGNVYADKVSINLTAPYDITEFYETLDENDEAVINGEAQAGDLVPSQQNLDALAAGCDDACAIVADSWILRMSECGDLAGNEAELREKLIAVCVNGCDVSRPFGATTVRDTPSEFGHSSFEEVITAILGTNANCDLECVGSAITFPGPYDSPSYLGALNAMTLTEIDADCMCENITKLSECYDAEPLGYSTFSEYLLQFSDIILSEEDIATLQQYCPESDCNTFPATITIPPYLECNTCKTCDEVQTVYDDFMSTCSLDAEGIEQLRTRYLNEQLGMNYTPGEYADFFSQCAALTTMTCQEAYVLCPDPAFGGDNSAEDDCRESLLEQARVDAQLNYDALVEELRQQFIAEYLSSCLSTLNDSEVFTTEGLSSEYHFTLYYYDQAGNLSQTIPPKGVDLITGTASHDLPTKYIYNTLNEVVSQESPDATESKFWYDKVGRLVVSQDGRQRENGLHPDDQIIPVGQLYSYTLYDRLGRITEVGELRQDEAMTIETARDQDELEDWLNEGSNRRQVTQTFYDESPIDLTEAFGDTPPTNLRNRVASVTFEADYDGDATTYEYASHYNYDATGNVKTLIQEIVALHPNGHGFKRLDYDYDYISGNVNAVYYQRGQADQFSHRYEYDANNRLTNVYTNIVETNELSHFWEEDARYEYYLHGPLARVEMGEQKVQGMDYAYNLQGWIKGVNSSALVAEKDMGQDGLDNTSPAKDALGYTLGYFNGDYQPINPAVNFEMQYDGTTLDQSSPSLYNGNIRNMIISNRKLGGTNGYVYQYDQLHRIKQMQTVKNPDMAGYTWGGSTLEDHFKTNYTYDPNGNLETLDRKDDVGADLDKLAYDYYENTNRLKRVADNAVNSLPEEIEQVQHQTGNGLGINYLYDGSGNLIEDVQAYTKIKWTPYGKVDYVDYDTDENDAAERRVSYGYDAMQNRVVKSDYDRITNEEQSSYYFRDAQGNVMAIYERDASGTIKWKEQHLYGSSRLGILQPNVEWAADELPEAEPHYTRIALSTTGSLGLSLEGWKRYELSNHLGNVLSVVNDRKSYVDNDEDGVADYYVPAILSATDYYPFGMAMANRTFSTPMPNMPMSDYRYGFNGKEKDKDLNGDLTHYDYGFRIYNAGIGKFLSVDPLTRQFPFYTPYQFAGNSPMENIDLDGLEPKSIKRLAFEKDDKPVLEGGTWRFIHHEAGERIIRESHGFVYSVEFIFSIEGEVTYPHMGNKTFQKIGNKYYELNSDGSFSPQDSKTFSDYVSELQSFQDNLNTISETAALAVELLSGRKGSKADDAATGLSSKADDAAEGASDASKNSALGEKMKKDLAFQEKSSLFKPDGTLKQTVIDKSKPIISGDKLGNEGLKNKLKEIGGELSDWNKMSYNTGGSKGVDVHYYHNSKTGKTYYGGDYKSKLGGDYFKQTPKAKE